MGCQLCKVLALTLNKRVCEKFLFMNLNTHYTLSLSKLSRSLCVNINRTNDLSVLLLYKCDCYTWFARSANFRTRTVMAYLHCMDCKLQLHANWKGETACGGKSKHFFQEACKKHLITA